MIGILTFQATNNFGAYLHTIALYKKIKELGYDCEVIDYLSPNLIRRETILFRNLGFNLKHWGVYFLWGRVLEKKYKVLREELRKYVTLSQQYTPCNIKTANLKYDTFMIGSDVVWSLRITDYDYNFFLDFADKNKKKIAFSSSVGETELFRNDKKLPSLLKEFAHIAVREEEAVDWVRDISGKEALYVCDPTMLFTGDEWDKIICPKSYSSDYILAYFYENKKMHSDMVRYAAKHHLKIKVINYGRKIPGVENVQPKTLAEFVGLIKYSQALFTASYHGMLFALYYHREVFFYNRGLKARMASLSAMLELGDHNAYNIKDVTCTQKIDYAEIDKKIAKFRNNSIEVLKEMLGK